VSGSGNNPQMQGSGGDGSQDWDKYVINAKQFANFVVWLGEKVAQGMRVGVNRSKYSIQIPLPPCIDRTVSVMTVEGKPDVTYDDVGRASSVREKDSVSKVIKGYKKFSSTPKYMVSSL